jgi:hypothetical protein
MLLLYPNGTFVESVLNLEKIMSQGEPYKQIHQPLHDMLSRLQRWISNAMDALLPQDFEKNTNVYAFHILVLLMQFRVRDPGFRWAGEDIRAILEQIGVNADSLAGLRAVFEEAVDMSTEAEENGGEVLLPKAIVCIEGAHFSNTLASLSPPPPPPPAFYIVHVLVSFVVSLALSLPARSVLSTDGEEVSFAHFTLFSRRTPATCLTTDSSFRKVGETIMNYFSFFFLSVCV